ncbi:MAG: 3-deoxy-D-manno-octulosonic acid transferase [Acidobacteria bacterium]|nr:3-deoxy-D-manno-octulosonic acid transferase [Acidobacteriota bacterium]
MLFIYSFLVLLASLALIPLSFILNFTDPEIRHGWKERLGLVPRLPDSAAPRLWIHAVSVGEVQLARQLLAELSSRRPEVEVLLSSTTAAGRRLAAGAKLPKTRICALPLDLSSLTRRALLRTRPNLLILMETEIWPNLIRQCAAQGIPVLIANGRISSRSFPRYRLLGAFLGRTLASVDRFLMQSEGDAGRIRALGAPADRMEVTGNLKWDLPAPEQSAASIRRELGLPPEAPVFVAGSTFEGEESVVLDAWDALRREFPSLCLVLAPRHPRRFQRVSELLTSRGIPHARQSRPTGNTCEVLLLDTLGDLRRAYGAATLCFVGGSLVSRGGQNLLEPAAAGRPVLFGPRTENFADASRALLDAGAGFRIDSASALLPAAIRLLRDPEGREAAGRRGAALVAANRGATRKTAERILAYLPASRS